jgi:hypothetical protein
MAADDEINGFIVLVAIILTVTIFGTVGRLWILRHRPRTLAVNISDAAFVFFTVLMVISAGVAYDGVQQELRIRRKYGSQEVDTRLFTTRYLKVRLFFAFFRNSQTKYVRLQTDDMQEFFSITLFCTTQVWLLKAAFLGYYWSLRDTLADRIKILLYITSAYCAVTYVGVISFQLAYCGPLSKNW